MNYSADEHEYMELKAQFAVEAEEEKALSLEEDMERNPEMYKEYFDEEVHDVKPDYPTTGGYMVVDHQSMAQMGGEKPCFHSMDDAVMWAEYNLQHNNYNVYELKTRL
tara:strand:+ start:142 stop:465 length:324 start_codon:yes stop_codon:yes gene_type:complete